MRFLFKKTLLFGLLGALLTSVWACFLPGTFLANNLSRVSGIYSHSSFLFPAATYSAFHSIATDRLTLSRTSFFAPSPTFFVDNASTVSFGTLLFFENPSGCSVVFPNVLSFTLTCPIGATFQSFTFSRG